MGWDAQHCPPAQAQAKEATGTPSGCWKEENLSPTLCISWDCLEKQNQVCVCMHTRVCVCKYMCVHMCMHVHVSVCVYSKKRKKRQREICFKELAHVTAGLVSPKSAEQTGGPGRVNALSLKPIWRQHSLLLMDHSLFLFLPSTDRARPTPWRAICFTQSHLLISMLISSKQQLPRNILAGV